MILKNKFVNPVHISLVLLYIFSYGQVIARWVLSYSEAGARRCFAKKAFLEISQNSQGNTCDKSLIFNEVAGLK